MWNYENNNIENINSLPNDVYGFIYLIHNMSKNRYYIGKKNIFFSRKKPLTKKEISLLENKRTKKWKLVVTESDWLTYNGSCKELLKDISNGDTISKCIVKFCFSARELTYEETKALFINNVLEREDYYNENILSKFFKGNIK